MSCSNATVAGAATVALSVARFTDAVTSGIRDSLPCTRAAHAAHVIPLMDSSTSLSPAADALSVTAADDITPAFHFRPAIRLPLALAAKLCRWKYHLRHPRIYAATKSQGNMITQQLQSHEENVTKEYPGQVLLARAHKYPDQVCGVPPRSIQSYPTGVYPGPY
jgi:hypothetical protein